MAWSAERLVLSVALPRPDQLQIAAEGRQRLRISGNPEVSYTADQVGVVLPLRAARWPPYLDVTVDHLRAKMPEDAGVDTLGLHLDLHPEAHR